MSRLAAALVAALLGLTALTGAGSAAGFRADPEPRAHVGSGSGGDPYFPADGNGGYDVRHYRIRDTYRIGNDRLRGLTVLRARAHDNLVSFNLDLALTPDA